MVSFLLHEVRKACASEAEAATQARALLRTGAGYTIRTPAALFLAKHRASKFRELVEHSTGQRPGPAPTEYRAGSSAHPRWKPMRGSRSRHGYRDERTDDEMLHDLEACVTLLSETVSAVDRGCACILM